MERKYKDSGIDWIGRIPESWDVDIAKRVFKQRRDKGNEECQLLAATQKYGMYPQHLLEGVVKVAADTDLSLFKTVHKNDYVISLRSFQGGFEMSDYEGVCSPAYQVFYATRQISNQYYKYLFKSDAFIQEINSLTVGIREGKNILYDDFALLPIPIPAASDQQRIADFLDKKCGEIDSLIALQEQMIEKLKAYKQSVITEAVTKGLDPNVKFVPSGVDWIGEIPEGWKVSKAKNFVLITNGSDPKTEGMIPVYGSGASSFKTCGEYKEGPTVLIGRKGATLHIPHYIEGKYWNVDTAFDVKSKGEMILRYYYYLAVCFDYKYYISQTTLPGMAQSSYYNMNIPIPPISEQQTIAAYLDSKCADIDRLIALKQQKIESLKEYKKSVIYEAVTGKTIIE